MCPESENNERINEFGQYEYKVQEKVTTKKIEHDLQQNAGNDIWILLLMTPFCALFIGMFVWLVSEFTESGKISPFSIVSLTVIGIVCAFFAGLVIVCLIYNLYMLFFGHKKFSVAIDRFRGIRTVVRHRRGIRAVLRHRRRGPATHHYLLFNKFGKVEFVPELEYYTWSEHYRMFGDGVGQSSHIGDRFFLIMRGKKIVYFYNDRMFDLSETLKSVRVIGEDPDTPNLNGEVSDNNTDNGGEEKVFH